MKLIAVTGAGGFIGSSVVDDLLLNGFRVRALIKYNSKADWGFLSSYQNNPHANLDVWVGNVCDQKRMNEFLEGCDIILHLAALIGIPYSYLAPESYLQTNIQGSFNILEAAKLHKVARIVMTSTSEVYGSAKILPIKETHPLLAQSPYAATKIAADKLAESYFCTFDLPVVILRPFNTFGPRQSSRAVIPTVLTQLMRGAKVLKMGNLTPKRDLTFVRDTAKAFRLAALASGIEGETIHFGTGISYSVEEIVTKCMEATGNFAEIAIDEARVRPDKSEVEHLLCDPEKSRRLLKWSPDYTLDTGLLSTVDYLKQNLDPKAWNTYAV